VPGLPPIGWPWRCDGHFSLIGARVARPPEDEIQTTDPPDPALRTVLHDATVDLRDIAVAIDRASAILDPRMELLEASHAIHRALTVLSDLCDSTEAGSKVDGSK
jgi:hypothetical protein